MRRALAAVLVAAALAGCAAPQEDAFSPSYIARQRDLCNSLADGRSVDVWACIIAAQDRELAKPAPYAEPLKPSWPTLERGPSF